MGPSNNGKPDTTGRLCIMMFLQFFAWGAWFATLGLAMTNGNLVPFIGAAYEAAPIAAIIAPLFLGLIADRFFASEKVFGALMLIGGGLMLLLPGVAGSATEFANESMDTLKQNVPAYSEAELNEKFTEQQLAENTAGTQFGWLILAYMLCYMPTLGLGNTIAFTHISSSDKFPLIRVWGTIGWIVAGLVIGFTGWDGQYLIFWLGGISSLLLGAFCFMLPNTPPPLKDKPMDLRSLFMVDAFKLLGDWNFLIFAVCSTLICIPLAYYYGSTSQFLGSTGFAAAGATMTLGQMSEILFMLMIPLLFRRMGVKWMIIIGMAAWIVRYLLFSFGAPDQVTWMLLAAVILHGICYDFFFVTGFMYTDEKAPKEIRGQAQSLLVFLTQGVGMFFGYRIMAAGNLFGIPLDITFGQYGEQVTSLQQFTDAVKEVTEEADPPTFMETLMNMFNRNPIPEGVDAELVSTTMGQWQNFWMFPAIFAAGVLVIFVALFWDKTKSEEEARSDK
ncbi:MAG: MFS transporter [Planctomycetota bacterium]